MNTQNDQQNISINKIPQPMIADISNQLSKEIIPDASNINNIESIETARENPPFLRSEPVIISKKIDNSLSKAIHFRKTLKNKKYDHYQYMGKSERDNIKKKIIHHFIHILRTSTRKNTFEPHKKMISNLRHTFNKHLDYIEKINNKKNKN